MVAAPALAALCLRALLMPAAGDIHNYRTAAAAFVRGFGTEAEPGERLYEPLEFQRWCERDGWRGQLATFVPQPPAALLPYLPVAWLGLHPARIAIGVATLALFVWTLAALARDLATPPAALPLALLASGGAMTANLRNGQLMLLVAALVHLTLRGLAGRRDTGAGAALGAALALKLFGAPLLLLLALRRRWVAIAAALVTGAALSLLACTGFGWPTLARYVTVILPASVGGSFHNLYHPESQSIETILRRLLLTHPDWNPSPPWPAPAVYGALSRFVPLSILGITLVILWEQSRALPLLAAAASIVATLLAAPAVNRYHVAPLAAVLLVLATRVPVRSLRAGTAFAAVAVAAWAPQGGWPVLEEPRPLGLGVLFAILVVVARPRTSRLATAVAVAAAAALAFPAPRPSAPERWRRVTPAPFAPLFARSPAADGSALELRYQPDGAGAVRFEWPGYSYDRSASLERAYERLTGAGRSGIWLEDALGQGRWVVALPDADARRPRFRGRRLCFDLERGRPVGTLELDLATGHVGKAAPLPASVPVDPALGPASIAPDGHHLAYAVRVGRRTEIREVDLDRGSERVLVEAEAWSVDPRYSWDGRRLFFASDAGRCTGCTVIYEVPR